VKKESERRSLPVPCSATFGIAIFQMGIKSGGDQGFRDICREIGLIVERRYGTLSGMYWDQRFHGHWPVLDRRDGSDG
jgi:hypothetical protein